MINLKNTTFLAAFAGIGAIIALPAHATLFSATATVGSDTEFEEFSTFEEVFDFAETNNLDDLFPSYTDSSAFDAVIDYRGLEMTFSYAENSNTLVFEVPSLGISESFTGTSRDGSSELLGDFMTSEGDEILNEIQQELAASSPVDPIAGNPNSLQGQITSSAFSSGGFSQAGSTSSSTTTSSTTTTTDSEELVVDRTSSSNRRHVELVGGTFTSGDLEGQTLTLPIGYTVRFDANPEYQLQFSLPITYTSVEGAASYAVSTAIGLQMPVANNWYVTPQLTYGLVGSLDLGSAAQMLGASVTSKYIIPMGRNRLTVGNMLGNIRSLPFQFDDLSFDPGLQNTVLKNGVLFEMPMGQQVAGNNTSIELSYANTAMFGSELFLNNYHEIGVSFGTSGAKSGFLASVARLGLTYTFGDEYTSISINGGYTF